jgi:hypothetical protein
MTVQHVLSLSYGKDSLACLEAIKQLGWPLDRIIHAEVWATDTIPADPPPMVEFKAKADKIIKERYGIEVEHLCAVRNGEKLTYEKLFYHVPKRKAGGKFSEESPAGFPYQKGAWCNDRLKTSVLDRVASGAGGIAGFPFTIGSWCKKLKDGSYPRRPHHPGTVVYQRPQTPGFPKAPLHKEPRQILCSTSVLLLMSRSASHDTRSRGSSSRWWSSGGTRPTAASGARRMTCYRPSTLPQQGEVDGSATTKAWGSSAFSVKPILTCGHCF